MWRILSHDRCWYCHRCFGCCRSFIHFRYVPGRCYRIVSHEELRKWKSDDQVCCCWSYCEVTVSAHARADGGLLSNVWIIHAQIAAENTRGVAHTGINTSLVDDRFANTFLDLRTLFDEPTLPASMPDLLEERNQPPQTRRSVSDPPQIRRKYGYPLARSASDPEHGAQAARIRVPSGGAAPTIDTSKLNAAAKAKLKEQTRNGRGAYLGEGADNGHGGCSPPARRPHNGFHSPLPGGGGGGDGGGSRSVSPSPRRNGRRSSSGIRRPHIGRFSSLHQSSAPSFHHVDVGLGGG